MSDVNAFLYHSKWNDFYASSLLRNHPFDGLFSRIPSQNENLLSPRFEHTSCPQWIWFPLRTALYV